MELLIKNSLSAGKLQQGLYLPKSDFLSIYETPKSRDNKVHPNYTNSSFETARNYVTAAAILKVAFSTLFSKMLALHVYFFRTPIRNSFVSPAINGVVLDRQKADGDA